MQIQTLDRHLTKIPNKAMLWVFCERDYLPVQKNFSYLAMLTHSWQSVGARKEENN
jgi:hypothetical protein